MLNRRKDGGTIGHHRDPVYRLSDELVERLETFTAPSLKTTKKHLNIGHDQDDSHIQNLTVAAVEYFERVTGHYIQKQQREVTFSRRSRTAEVVSTPWQSLDSAVVLDKGEERDVDVSDLIVDPGPPVIVRVKDNTTLPVGERMRFTYTVGYDEQENVPEGIRQAIRLMVADLYEYRTSAPITGQTLEDTPFDFDALVAPYKVISI